jgi:hypothetical protein
VEGLLLLYLNALDQIKNKLIKSYCGEKQWWQ